MRCVIRWSILFCKRNSLWTMNYELLWEQTNLHGKVIEKAFPSSWPFQKVVDTTLESQHHVVLLAIVCSSIEQQWELSIDGRIRVVGVYLTDLVCKASRRRVGISRDRTFGGRWRLLSRLDRRWDVRMALHCVETGRKPAELSKTRSGVQTMQSGVPPPSDSSKNKTRLCLSLKTNSSL